MNLLVIFVYFFCLAVDPFVPVVVVVVVVELVAVLVSTFAHVVITRLGSIARRFECVDGVGFGPEESNNHSVINDHSICVCRLKMIKLFSCDKFRFTK